jgi:hypothetical protein
MIAHIRLLAVQTGRNRVHPPERVNLCAIAAALILSVCFPVPQPRKDTALPSLTLVDTMGATGKKSSTYWCAESARHVTKVKAWQQHDAYVIGMESASNSAARSPQVIDSYYPLDGAVAGTARVEEGMAAAVRSAVGSSVMAKRTTKPDTGQNRRKRRA